MNFICRKRQLCFVVFLVVSLGLVITSSCSRADLPMSGGTGAPADAETFITDAEKKLFDLNLKYSRADWVKSVFITDDTELLSADANKEVIAATTELAEQSRKFDGLQLSTDTARKLKVLKLALVLPAPKNPAERDELTKLAASLEGDYGKGK
jgi:peptidyl-dipeptidase A